MKQQSDLVVTGRRLQPGPGFRKLNPEFFGTGNDFASVPDQVVRPDPRPVPIKQDRKPILNKLESDWLAYLKEEYPSESFRWQDRRYKLANGVWYKPDITCQRHRIEAPVSCRHRETAWECKQLKGKNVDRGLVMLKVAAHSWPEITWYLVWRADGEWNEIEVLP